MAKSANKKRCAHPNTANAPHNLIDGNRRSATNLSSPGPTTVALYEPLPVMKEMLRAAIEACNLKVDDFATADGLMTSLENNPRRRALVLAAAPRKNPRNHIVKVIRSSKKDSVKLIPVIFYDRSRRWERVIGNYDLGATTTIFLPISLRKLQLILHAWSRTTHAARHKI